MKTIFSRMSSILLVLFAFSCTTVSSGHKGVKVSWGGETDMARVYPEGMDTGFHWIWDDMIEYDVRERTLVEKFTFNDFNNMSTGVEMALDYNYQPDAVNRIHTQITDIDVKILKTLKSAGKEVVPQYTASELNLSKRSEAEEKLSAILESELPEFYVHFARVQLTDVDIPAPIASAAEATARQLELNKLAYEKAEEAQNNFTAAEWDAKTKDILSQPKMLELQRVQNETLMWEGFIKHGESPYGNNNVFSGGGQGIGIFKGLN